MDRLSEKEKIEMSRILESVQGRIDRRLVKLTLDIIMNSKWTQEIERDLYKKNIERIPERAIDAVLIGSHIGQTYQVSLDLSKKMGIELKPLQKNILREFVFFLILFRTEIESKKRARQDPQSAL